MMKLPTTLERALVLFSFLSLLAARPGSAALIVIDYTHDTFFAANPLAKAALEAAASDISAAITTSLSAITASHDVIGTTAGDTTVEFDHDFTYTNPTTGATETITTPTIELNTIRIFAGVQNLLGDTLGVGGPGSFVLSAGASFDTFANLQSAVTAAASQSSTVYGRGNGPTIATLSGAFVVEGQGTVNYSVGYGSSLGNIWFDVDTDNDGVADSNDTLTTSWHFDHTTAVAENKDDFYSVALHELLHAVGMGTAETWFEKVDGSNWTGAEVINLVGSGTGLVSGGHIVEGTMSTRISDGLAQEVVMDPSLTEGTRKYLTALDLAFLRDIGWDAQPQAVPEPSTMLLSGLALVSLVGYEWWRRRRVS